MRCIAAALLVTPAVTLVAPIARAPSQCMASSVAIDVRGAFVMSPYVDMHAIDATPARRRVLQSQAEIASFMEATLPQDKGETLPASPILDFEKGPEGLLYKDDVVGTGPSPTVGDELEVHYAGWYYAPGSTEGVKFDDSRDRDATKGLMFELGIAPIIKGWSLGLETMKQGGKRSLIIPPTLGYGDVEVSSAGRPSIPPNSELRFELELVTVNNDIIRKMRRSLNDFLRPQGSDFVSPEEKQAIKEGTLKKPLIEQLFQKKD